MDKSTDFCGMLKELLETQLSSTYLNIRDVGGDSGYCTFDLAEKNWARRIQDKRCKIQSSSSVTMHRETTTDVDGKSHNWLSADILIPNCPGYTEYGKQFLLTPSVDLCENFKIDQIHFHGAGSPCPVTHVHLEADMMKTINSEHCFRKFVGWLHKLSEYTEGTCIRV